MGLFNRKSPISREDRFGRKDQTTKTIALVLLWGFVISLGILFFTNIFNLYLISHYKASADKPSTEFEKVWLEFQKSWLELLKNGLIFLSSALTTVIGYYFGQKEGSAKSAEAERIVKKTEKQAELVSGLILDRDQAIRESSSNDNDSPDDETSPTLEDGDSVIVPK
jgi:hypothetical protein